MRQECESVLKKLKSLSKEQVRKQLRVQLVSSVGTFGSIHGCTLDEAVAEFKEDWDEELTDYALALGYSSVLLMLSDMDAVRLEFSGREFRVCAVAAPDVLHCFNLIDRTRPRIRCGHRKRKQESKPVVMPTRSRPFFYQPLRENQLKTLPNCYVSKSGFGMKGHLSFVRDTSEASLRMCGGLPSVYSQQNSSEFSKSAPSWDQSDLSSSLLASSGFSEFHPSSLRDSCASSVKHSRFGGSVYENQNWKRLFSGWY